MNLSDLRYFVSVAEHRHFGRAAVQCHVSQPTLSMQIRKLEEELGVTLIERTNRRVALTAAGERILEHAKRALEAAALVGATAEACRNPLAGALRMGVIPTLAPYLAPLILGPLRDSYPSMKTELWEDLTAPLLEGLRRYELDCALIATEPDGTDLTSIALFVEPFLAALPEGHPLASKEVIRESDLEADILVLAEGHCLAVQTLSACGRAALPQQAYRAASLETLINLVAAGYGTTLVPALAASAAKGKVVLRPLAGGSSRTVRLASRVSFPRAEALRAVEKVVRKAVSGVLC